MTQRKTDGASKTIRAFPELQIRQHENGSATLVGHAAVFNSPSRDLGGFTEIVAPGTFSRTLRENQDVFAFADHDSSRRLARTRNGSLRLSEDDRGLAVEIDVPDTDTGRSILADVRAGLLDAMSFGFRTVVDQFEERDDGMIVRTLKDVDLFEVSPVSIGAYAAASIQEAQRAFEEHKQRQQQDIEEHKVEIIRRRLRMKQREFDSIRSR